MASRQQCSDWHARGKHVKVESNPHKFTRRGGGVGKKFQGIIESIPFSCLPGHGCCFWARSCTAFIEDTASQPGPLSNHLAQHRRCRKTQRVSKTATIRGSRASSGQPKITNPSMVIHPSQPKPVPHISFQSESYTPHARRSATTS